jgi:C-terminal processing protease CtpA/Prc
MNMVATTDNLKGITEYWQNTLEECFVENKSELSAYYYDGGEYIHYKDADKTLIAVDGTDVHEYAKNLITLVKIQYDFINKRPYRAVLAVNDSVGTPVTLTIKNADGSLSEEQCYVDMISEFDYIKGDEIPEKEDEADREAEANDKTKHYSITHINENNYYVEVRDMDNNVGLELYKELMEISSTGVCNFIIDLRSNPGGLTIYAPQFVYPPLFENDVIVTGISYINRSKNNNKIWNDFFSRDYYQMEKAEKDEDGNSRFMMKSEIEFRGSSDYRHNIYILAGEATVSAADAFTAAAKLNDNAVIIGTNTAGEGIQAMLFAEILPKSKLVYMYNPAKCANPDGTSNGIYGTAPDIYADVDRAGYAELLKISDAGGDPYTLENRLKWDNVLLTAIEQIEEQENEPKSDT